MLSPSNSKRISQAVLAAVTTAIVVSGCNAPTDAPVDKSAASSSSSVAGDFTPVTVENCGVKVEVSKQPTHIITLNQGATESMLGLGAADQMVGTAYLDDAISPELADTYAKVPVLDEKYPSHEVIVDTRPDFIVASYASAFDDKVAGSREELAKLGIASYLDPFACKEKSQRSDVSWDSIKNSVTDLGKLSGHNKEAEEIVSDIAKRVDDATAAKAGEGHTVFWWDSKTDAPFAGAGNGGPQLLMQTVGAKNIFADVEGNWADVSWEAVLAANPDYIVVADASWDTAQSKIDFAKSDPSLKELDAVKNDRFIIVPFSESTPNVRTARALERLTEGFKK